MSRSGPGGDRAVGAGASLARVLLGVRGLDTDEARVRVRATLLDLPGVSEVEHAAPQQLLVRYDPTESTVMDMIRAVRRLGFLAGMA